MFQIELLTFLMTDSAERNVRSSRRARLRSYGAALRDLGLADRNVTGGRSNNRSEISPQPTRPWAIIGEKPQIELAGLLNSDEYCDR
jgi:hypothetical protein